jgi:hypothetical protein
METMAMETTAMAMEMATMAMAMVTGTTATATATMATAMVMETTAMAMVMGTMEMAMETATMAMAMVMVTEMAITMMIQQITKTSHQQKQERNELTAMQKGPATPKPFNVHLNAHRGSPRATRRIRDASSTVVASAKSLASVRINSFQQTSSILPSLALLQLGFCMQMKLLAIITFR